MQIEEETEKDLEDEALPDLAGGMVRGVLLLGEIPRLHERDGDGVAEHHLNSGGCHRREVERTELSLERQMHGHVARRGERVAFNGGERDEERAVGPRTRHKAEELLGGAGLAEEDEHIAIGEDSNVAVESVHRREERGANAQRDERLRDLVRDEAGFSDAGEEDGAGGIEERAREG